MLDAALQAPTAPPSVALAAKTAGAPLRVLVTSYRAHPHVGGQGVYVRELTRALADQGHAVEVAAGPPYPDLDPRVRLHRLASLDLFATDNALAAFRWRFLADRADLAEWLLHNTGAFGEPFAFGVRLARWLASERRRFDVVHDNQGLFSSLVGVQRRIAPAAATLHHPITVDLDYALAAAPRAFDRALIKRWHRFLAMQKRVARALPALLTVSEASKARAVSDFGLDPRKIRVAANGIDHAVFRPRPDIAREADLCVAACSADLPIKGADVLMRAFARIARERPSARLIVVGKLKDGPSARALAEAGLGDRVRFETGLATEAMAELYARAALVLVPSRFEGFGFPAAEAMACGAAVAASDGGALPEVVGDAGLLAAAGDDSALADAGLRLLNDASLRARLGAAAHARAKAAFCWRAHAQAALDLYRDIGATPISHAHDRV